MIVWFCCYTFNAKLYVNQCWCIIYLKNGLTYRRQVVNPHHQTKQGQLVAVPVTLYGLTLVENEHLKQWMSVAGNGDNSKDLVFYNIFLSQFAYFLPNHCLHLWWPFWWLIYVSLWQENQSEMWSRCKFMNWNHIVWFKRIYFTTFG